MDKIFNKISISLIVLGIAFYVFAMTFTALIPSILGLLMQIVLFLGRKFSKFHKHFSHINMLILVLGIGATYGSVFDIINYLIIGAELERPLASIEQFTTCILCITGLIVGIKSFTEARKK